MEEIKPSEFYQKYWRIKTKDGWDAPPPLSKSEIEFLDNAAKSIENGSASIIQKRRRGVTIDVRLLNEQISNFPNLTFIE